MANTTTKQLQLRHYQRRAIDRFDERVAAGIRRLVFVLATGGGKTSIAAAIILRAIARGQRVLFLAHRRELINQAYRRLIEAGIPEELVGVIMASDPRRRPGAPIQVASVDTMRHRARPLADIVFVDECHRALAASYRSIAADYPDAIHIGLTATPYRADGRGLDDAYDELLVIASPRELIAEGHLVEPRIITVDPSSLPDLSRVRTRGGDYDERALAAAVDKKVLVGNIVEHWRKHADGIRTVAFAVSVEHSKHIAERFREAGVPAEHLDGTTETRDRDAILGRVERGETLVVANVGVLCEGTDLPPVKCAILARPTKSTGLYIQQAGRILRPWQGQRAIILDHAGCYLEHGLPHADREFTLAGRKKRRKEENTVESKAEPQAKTCPACYCVLALEATECPACGHSLGSRPRELPQEAEGELVLASELDIETIALDQLRAEAAARGYKDGWVYHRFRERFGKAPPSSSRSTKPSAPARADRVLTNTMRTAAQLGGRMDWSMFDSFDLGSGEA